MNTGSPSHSARGERPITRPASTPPAAVSARPTRPPSVARFLDGAHCALERLEAPEVLDLEVRRVTLELLGRVVELEVLLGGLLAAAVLGEQTLLGGLLVVGQQLLLQLGRQVGQQPEPLPLFDHELGV